MIKLKWGTIYPCLTRDGRILVVTDYTSVFVHADKTEVCFRNTSGTTIPYTRNDDFGTGWSTKGLSGTLEVASEFAEVLDVVVSIFEETMSTHGLIQKTY